MTAAEGLELPDHPGDPPRLDVRLDPFEPPVPLRDDRLHGVGRVFEDMEHIEHAGDLPAPEELVAGVPDPFGPVGDGHELPGVVQAPAQRLPVKARGETGRLPASGMRQPDVSLPRSFSAAPVSGLPSSCFPATPSTSPFRIGIPVPSMDRCMRGSNGLPSTASSRSNRRASSPRASDRRCSELGEASTPARFAMRLLAASKPVAGTVPAMTLAMPGVKAPPSSPRARSGGKRPLPHDRQWKCARSTSIRPSRVRNDFPVAGCRRIGLPQPSLSGVGSMPSSRSGSSFSADAKGAVAERPLHAVKVGNAGREVRRKLRKLRPELRRNGSQQLLKRPAVRPEARQRQLVFRDVAAPHLAALQPALREPAVALADHRRMNRRLAFRQSLQIRHRVRMPMPVVPLVPCHGSRSCPLPESAPPTGSPGRCRARLPEQWSQKPTGSKNWDTPLACLVEDVMLRIDRDADVIGIVVHWKGGVADEFTVPLQRRRSVPEDNTDTVELVRQLVRLCNDAEISGVLNQLGRATPKGLPFSRDRVHQLRKRHGIPAHARRAGDSNAPVVGVIEASRQLKVSDSTICHWISIHV